MKSLILSLFAVAIGLSAYAQPHWRWAKKDSAANYSINPGYPRQVIAAAKDKVMWGVIQNKKVSYGQAIMGDYMFREMDSLGNTVVTASATGKFTLLQAQADANGNWYVLGTFYDTVSLSPGMTLSRNWSGTGADHFLFRLHAGTLSPDWIQLIGNNYNSSASCFAISNGELYLPVDSAFNTHFYKYDLATGAATKMWTQTGRSYTTDIQVDSIGNVYVIGNCVLNGPLNFNGTTSVAPGSGKYPWYIARYHADGQHHWHYYLTDITCNGRGFKLAGNNEIYLTGTLSDSTSLVGFTFNKPPTMFNSDFLMARLDSNGSLIWAQQRPVTSITQGSVSFATSFHTAVVDTTLFMLCETTGNAIWGNGGIATATNGRHFATLIGYNKNTGAALWAKTITGLFTTGQHIITDGQSIWATGNGMDSTSIVFDTVSVSASAGVYVPYIAKMQVAKKAVITPTTLVGSQRLSDLKILPNPASNFVTVDGLHGDEQLFMRDVFGRIVLPVVNNGAASQHINTSSLTRGIYFLEIRNGDSRIINRLVLQ